MTDANPSGELISRMLGDEKERRYAGLLALVDLWSLRRSQLPETSRPEMPDDMRSLAELSLATLRQKGSPHSLSESLVLRTAELSIALLTGPLGSLAALALFDGLILWSAQSRGLQNLVQAGARNERRVRDAVQSTANARNWWHEYARPIIEADRAAGLDVSKTAFGEQVSAQLRLLPTPPKPKEETGNRRAWPSGSAVRDAIRRRVFD